MDESESLAFECHAEQLGYLVLVLDEQHDASVGHQYLVRGVQEVRRFLFENRKKSVR